MLEGSFSTLSRLATAVAGANLTTPPLASRWVQSMLGDATALADVMEFMQEIVPFAVPDAEQMLEDANREMATLMTRPFGDIDLNEALRNRRMTRPEEEMDAAQRKSDAKRIRAQRRFDRQALRSGLADSNFGQANFLLFKQLLYFDRYGKLYLADESLLANRDLLESLVGTSALDVTEET